MSAPSDEESPRPAASPNETSPPPPQVIIVSTVVVPVAVPVPVPVPIAVPAGKDAAVPAAESCVGNPPSVPAASALKFPSNAPAAKFFRKIGGAGFLASAGLHLFLLIFAVFWVFSESVVPAEAESVFVSGSGGGNAGTRAERFSERAVRRKPNPLPTKIVSANKNPALTLPAMPEIRAPAAKFSLRGGAGTGAAGDGADAAGTSSGFGGGLGSGTGIGVGGGKNHLGKFKTLLGAKIEAQRIAVYLDCSGSMARHLDAVKAEIYEKFPDADIFSYSGAQTEVHDGSVVGGRAFKAKQLAALRRRAAEDATDSARLSPQGKTIYRKFAPHFAAGTLGAWLDVMSRERYDALVVFSDFRDGVRQRRGGKTVFADSSYAPSADGRTARERKWESDWRAAFSRAGAPKLYLFSAGTAPQTFLESCVSASGGESVALDLKKRKKNKN